MITFLRLFAGCGPSAAGEDTVKNEPRKSIRAVARLTNIRIASAVQVRTTYSPRATVLFDKEETNMSQSEGNRDQDPGDRGLASLERLPNIFTH
jgi:hypothetical protein